MLSTEIYIDSMMKMALDSLFFPGAQIIVGSRDSIFISKNYGYHDYSKQHPVGSEDVYDLASLTKVLATTAIVMQLAGQKELSLDDQLGNKVKRYKKTPLEDITLAELLTHTTGLKPGILFYKNLLITSDECPLLSASSSDHYKYIFGGLYVHRNIQYNPLYVSKTAKDNSVKIYNNLWLDPMYYTIVQDSISQARKHPKGAYLYSDLNMILIQDMIKSVTHRDLDELSQLMYQKLGISRMGYRPLDWSTNSHIIPTEVDNLFRKDTLLGYVHDETAAIFGGVSGNAGLFANASSIAVMAQMFLNHGIHDGNQILSPKVIKQFKKSPLKKYGIYRGLGFDKREPNNYFGKNDFGHTGYTGTFFFINPDTERFLIVLTNRVYPTRTNRKMYNDKFCEKLWKEINKR